MANVIPARPVKLNVLEIYKEAWRRLSGATLPFVFATLIMFTSFFALAFGVFAVFFIGKVEPQENLMGFVLSIIFQCLFVLYFAGFFRMALRHITGHKISGMDVLYFVTGNGPTKQLIIVQFAITICTFIGFLFFVLPGIYLALTYSLTFFLIADREIGFWEAMESSRKALTSNLLFIIGFFIITYIIALIATIPFGLGWIWAFPLYFIALAVVYEKLFGIQKS